MLELFRTAFTQHPEDFKALYGNNLEVVKDALTNNAPATTAVNPRNVIWYQNIKEIISKNKIKKFIGFFGGAHTTYSNKSSLTNTLKKVDFFEGNILNIATMYTHILNLNGTPKIIEYDYKEKDVVDAFYNKQCRTTIVNTNMLPKMGFKTASDYVLFAKEYNDVE